MKVKRICCIGAGFVGGPTMAVIALKCPELNITVVDVDSKKIDLWNSKDLNKLPVYEPGLNEIIKKVRNRNLFFSKDIKMAIEKSEMIFLAVNTPTKTKGKGKGMEADLTNIIYSAKQIARFSKSDKIVVEKSTLPVRTAEKLKKILKKENDKLNFDIISNPEFLAEGTAIQDLYKSDRVLIGANQDKRGELAAEKLVEIYSKWIPKKKIIRSNVWSAELSKLASNAMLAQRISSINSLSALCKKTDADILDLSKAIGADKRIGKDFLNPSVGFGGSCFQKDILNLVYICKSYGLNEVAEFWHQVIKINDYQKNRFSDIIINKFGSDFHNKKTTILGWAFKKNTNDSRESASIYVTSKLLERGISVNVYDPMVPEIKITEDLIKLWKHRKISSKSMTIQLNKLKIYQNPNHSIEGSDCVAILTEWDEFKNYDWEQLTYLMNKNSFIVDGRKILNNKTLKTEILSI